ncbi:MAG TPA: 50S ribosomal protein L5, partial [Planctomycetota bacterium]|nr:50S ribosomal protein L5 [Planctomycetota bacterium]
MVKYNEEIVPELKKKLHRDNIMSIPKLEKIVVNMGVGKAIENKRRLENAVKDLSLIAGQRPVITKAKKSIAGFKLRAGQEIGCKVTLRNKRMYEFLDRL